MKDLAHDNEADWLQIQEQTLKKVWDNADDAVYDDVAEGYSQTITFSSSCFGYFFVD